MPRPAAMQNRNMARDAKRAFNVVLKAFEPNGGVSGIARSVGVRRAAVNGWRRRGFVSALAAIKLGALKIKGASKSDLRPDVEDWEHIRRQRKSFNTKAYAKLPA